MLLKVTQPMIVNLSHLNLLMVCLVDVALGLLHLEIIQERLEREYDLDIITTAPSVIYHVYTKAGEKIELTNPTSLPDPSEIASMKNQ